MEFLGKLFGHPKEPKSPHINVTIPPPANPPATAESRNRPPDTDAQPATAELLEELVHTEYPYNTRKFVRQGDRIVLARYGEHARIAWREQMETPDDAGRIARDPRIERLLVEGDSVSLRINRDNPHRPDTITLLRKIAPSIKILSEYDEEIMKELYRKK